MSVPEYRIVRGWLVEDTGVHDCAGGGPEASGVHEAHCGFALIMPVEHLHDLLTAEHRTEWGVRLSERPDRVHPLTGEPAARSIVRTRAANGPKAGSAVAVNRVILTLPWHDAPPDPDDPETWPFPPAPQPAAEVVAVRPLGPWDANVCAEGHPRATDDAGGPDRCIRGHAVIEHPVIEGGGTLFVQPEDWGSGCRGRRAAT